MTGREADEVSGEVVYVPFVRDSDNYVNSLLMVKMDVTDTIFRMVHDYSYKAFSYDTTNHSKWNARDVFNLFTSFDYSVFGHTKFWVKDTNLFKPENDSSYVIATRVNGSSHRKSARVSLYAVEECVTWEICTYPGAGPTGPDGSDPTPPGGGTSGGVVRAMNNCSYLDICSTYYYDDGGGGGGTTGTGDGTGGSGGTGWYGGSNPCTGSTPTAVPRLSNVAPGDGCGSGWEPVPTPTPPPSSDPCSSTDRSSGAMATLQYMVLKSTVSQFAPFDLSKTDQPEQYFVVNNINSTYVPGPIQTTATTGGSLIGKTDNTVITVHTHPNGGFPAPSPADIWDLSVFNSNYQMTYVIASDGTKYAVVVNSYSQFQAFVANNPGLINQNPPPGQYEPNQSSTKGLEWYDAIRFMKDHGYTETDAYMRATAYLFRDAGITIVKAPSGSDTFKKIGFQQQLNPDGTPTKDASGNPVFINADCQ